jgi:hypothetical protein
MAAGRVNLPLPSHAGTFRIWSPTLHRNLGEKFHLGDQATLSTSAWWCTILRIKSYWWSYSKDLSLPSTFWYHENTWIASSFVPSIWLSQLPEKFTVSKLRTSYFENLQAAPRTSKQSLLPKGCTNGRLNKIKLTCYNLTTRFRK